MGRYKGKSFDPNFKKSKTVAVASENAKDPEFGEKISPHAGILHEDYGYVNLLNILDETNSITHDDIITISEDSVVKSYREKLLGSAASQKSSYDYNNVNPLVVEYANDLKNNLDWDNYHRYGYDSSKYGSSIIQVLWENVDYEIIGSQVFAKTLRIYGFKQEDYRNYQFNTDKTLGNYGDTIYTPARENITKLYPYNFIVMRNKPDFLHPEGNTDLKELKTIITLKNFIIKTQARYVKKATVPSFVAIYKTNKKGADLTLEAQAISASLSGIENGAGIALPNIDQLVTLLPTAQTDFIRILAYIDSIIQLRVLGTSLLGGQMEKGGSYASAKVGATELENSVKQVALMLQSIDNIVIRYAIWQRFGTDTVLPRLLFDFSQKSTIEELTFMAQNKVPIDFAQLQKALPVAPGLQEPIDKMFFIGSPDGTLENLPSNTENKTIMSEEEFKEKDAQRKQDEEAEKLKQKEL